MGAVCHAATAVMPRDQRKSPRSRGWAGPIATELRYDPRVPVRLFRVLLPPGALAVFVLTLMACFRVARASGHLAGHDATGILPVISFFGNDEPERSWFRGGFTALAVILAIMLLVRRGQLAADPSLAGARARRALATGASVLAVIALLMMTWIPDGESPVHFFAALATFFFLVVCEIVETTLLLIAFRARGFRASHAVLLLWSCACAVLSLVCVAKWVAQADVAAQYAAVGLQFAYFLGAIPELARQAEPAR